MSKETESFIYKLISRGNETLGMQRVFFVLLDIDVLVLVFLYRLQDIPLRYPRLG